MGLCLLCLVSKAADKRNSPWGWGEAKTDGGINMKPVRTGEILPNLYAISNLMVNFYIVKKNQDYIAFDAGAFMDVSVKELGKLNIHPHDVSAIFLTHTDNDHVGGIGVFHRAKIYISKQEEPMINGLAKRTFITGYRTFNYSYETINDGETVNIGETGVQCIAAPGHSKGSACFILDGKYLFSGDSFRLKGGRVKPFSAVLNMDNNAHRKSIAKLSELQGIEAVFTGHHGYTEDFGRAFESWHKHSDATV